MKSIHLLRNLVEVDLEKYKELVDLAGYVWYLYEHDIPSRPGYTEPDRKGYEVLYCENVSKSPQFEKLYQWTYYYNDKFSPLVIDRRKPIKEINRRYIVGSLQDFPGSTRYTLNTQQSKIIFSPGNKDILQGLLELEKRIN
jgi:hypothetical protein